MHRERAAVAPQLEVLQPAVVEDRGRDAVLGVAPDRRPGPVGERAVVLDQAFERIPSQVEAVEIGVAALEPRHHAERLGVVVEAAVAGQAAVERALAGVPERRVAEIVGERRGLRQILVEAERTGERPGDLGDFERVCKARAVVVALMVDEYLGLVGEPAKSR